jgi:hypothetical protein
LDGGHLEEQFLAKLFAANAPTGSHRNEIAGEFGLSARFHMGSELQCPRSSLRPRTAKAKTPMSFF